MGNKTKINTILVRKIPASKVENNKDYEVGICISGYDKTKHALIAKVGNRVHDDLDENNSVKVNLTYNEAFANDNTYNTWIYLTVIVQVYDIENDQIIETKKQEYYLDEKTKQFVPFFPNPITAVDGSIQGYWHKNKLVAQVEGPYSDPDCKTFESEVKIGTRYYFRATPKQKLHQSELLAMKWSYRYDDEEITPFNYAIESAKGNVNIMNCVFHKQPKEIKVYAFYKSPSDKVCVLLDVFGAEVDNEEKRTEEEPLAENGASTGICIEEARVRAFMRMLRVGEATGELIKSFDKKTKKVVYKKQDPEKGYKIAFGGNIITDLSTHPQKNYDGSTAAGAYQIMRYTWWWLNGQKLTEKNKKAGIYEKDHDYVKKYNIPDYSPASQDKLCVIILKHKQTGLLKLIAENKIEKAIRGKGSGEWASLPHKGDNSRYDFNGKPQPATPMKVCMEHYEQFLKEELEGKSYLHLEKGFLKEFGINCSEEKNYVEKPKDEINNTENANNQKNIDLRDKMTFSAQKNSTDCNLTCRSIMNSIGVVPENPSGKLRESYYQTALETKDRKSIVYNDKKFKEGIKYIDKSLESGYPVMVGVHHTNKYNYNEASVPTSDHYVIIVGRYFEGETVKYKFWDVATRTGASGDFSFTLYNDKLFSNNVWKKGRTYTVTQIRRNNKKGKLITFD